MYCAGVKFRNVVPELFEDSFRLSSVKKEDAI